MHQRTEWNCYPTPRAELQENMPHLCLWQTAICITINNELHQPLMNNYNSPHRHVMKSKTLSRLVDAVYSRSVPVSWPGARIPQDVLFDLCRTLARSSESTLLHTDERIRMNRKELYDAKRPGKKCWLLSGAFIPGALYSTEKEMPHQKNSHFKVELK